MTTCSETLIELQKVTSATVSLWFDRRLKVGVVRTDTGGDDQLEFGRLGDPLGGHIGGPERLRDDDFGVRQLAIEDRIRRRPCPRSQPECGRWIRDICAGPIRRRRCREARRA